MVKNLGVETLLDSDPEGNVTTTKTFHLLRSSVLGGKVVSEIGVDSDQRGFVYLGDGVLALQYRTSQTVRWEHRDAGDASVRMTSSDGSLLSGGAEVDPLGNDAGTTNTVTPLSPRLWKLTVYPGFGGAGMDGATQCTVDRIMTSCSSAFGYVAAGVGTVLQGPGFYGDYVIINHRETPREGLQNFSQSVNNSSPQHTGDLKDLSYLTAGARNVIATASGDCAKLLGKDAVTKFDAISGNIQFKGDVGVHVVGLGGGVREGSLSEVPEIGAITDVPTKQVYLNPNGRAFNTYTRGGQPYHPLQSTFDKFGVTQSQYGFSVLIHEFLHTTGKFKPDSTIGLDGKVDSSKSQKYQEKLLKACFSQKKK